MASAAAKTEKTASDYRALSPGFPLIESPFFDRFADEAFSDSAVRRIANDLNRDGFAIIDFPEPDFAPVADAIRAELAPQLDFDTWRRDGWRNGETLRVSDAWKTNAHVKRIACNEALLGLIGKLYGRRAFPFQTLNFPVGSQQHYHSDSVHFSTIPERFMCGVWVALEDVREEAGPLVYYPGSHKWPVVHNDVLGHRVYGQANFPEQGLYEAYWEALVEQHDIAPAYFMPRKGQALIWTANLLHGGARQSDPSLTRWSQVTHYFCDDCVYLTPMSSDVSVGNLYLREPTDISTGKPVPSRYCGMDLRTIDDDLHTPRDTRRPRWTGMPDDFDARAYLSLNPDVAAAGLDAAAHFKASGYREGRPYRATGAEPSSPQVGGLKQVWRRLGGR